MGAKIPGMDYRQHRAACRLVHECCNYDNGNCILLDNGEPCVCVQSISYSLLCRWFIAAGRETGSRPFAPGRQETLYRVRRVFSPQVQPGEILPGLRRKSAPPERSRATTEKIPPFYAFRL